MPMFLDALTLWTCSDRLPTCRRTRAQSGSQGARGAFALHAAILEPHLHLSLGQLQRHGDLVAPQPRQVLGVLELRLEVGDLRARERGALLAVQLAGREAGRRSAAVVSSRTGRLRLGVCKSKGLLSELAELQQRITPLLTAGPLYESQIGVWRPIGPCGVRSLPGRADRRRLRTGGHVVRVEQQLRRVRRRSAVDGVRIVRRAVAATVVVVVVQIGELVQKSHGIHGRSVRSVRWLIRN